MANSNASLVERVRAIREGIDNAVVGSDYESTWAFTEEVWEALTPKQKAMFKTRRSMSGTVSIMDKNGAWI